MTNQNKGKLYFIGNGKDLVTLEDILDEHEGEILTIDVRIQSKHYIYNPIMTKTYYPMWKRKSEELDETVNN